MTRLNLTKKTPLEKPTVGPDGRPLWQTNCRKSRSSSPASHSPYRQLREGQAPREDRLALQPTSIKAAFNLI
jgi:hypothetical protein